MSINSHVVKSTVVGALGGLLFGFDTAVISGTTSALTRTYHLSPAMLGVTVSSALVGTVIGAMVAGIPGQKFGRRDSLRVMAIFYVLSAIGCASRLELARAHRLPLHRRTRHRWLVRSRSDVYRGDLTARLARPPRRHSSR